MTLCYKSLMDEARLLGARIKQLRKKRHLTQEGLAEVCGIHYKFLGGIERGSANPTLAVLRKIARAMNVPLAELFKYEFLGLSPSQVRKRLAVGIKRCEDAEALWLYRVYRSL